MKLKICVLKRTSCCALKRAVFINLHVARHGTSTSMHRLRFVRRCYHAHAESSHDASAAVSAAEMKLRANAASYICRAFRVALPAPRTRSSPTAARARAAR